MTATYLKISPSEICEDIDKKITHKTKVVIDEFEMWINPHVYPSHLFRTPLFIITSLKNLFKGCKVCDMGCGPGTIGLAALKYKASKVVQADINPFAVKNAQENKAFHKLSDDQLKIYESDCFTNIPKEAFDMIIFNIPFHPDNIAIEYPLQKAFFDPDFETLKKFLSKLPDFSHKGSQVFIAFTNRVNPLLFENVLEEYRYKWNLWAKSDQGKYDNRLYKIEF